MTSEYERERLDNIRRNEELMRELDVLGGSTKVGAAKPKRAQPPKSATSRRVSKPKADVALSKVPLRATRSSARLQGQEADSDTAKRKWEAEAEEARQAAERAKRARHEDRNLALLTDGMLDEAESELLRESLMRASESVGDTDAGCDADGPAAKLTVEAQELSKVFNRMALRSTSKVTPARVYSMLYHPAEDRDLVFTGDKEGNIGVWDALASDTTDPTKNEDEDEVALPGGRTWALQVHGKSPVSCLRIDPVKPDNIFSASYDSSIRVLSLTSSVSSEVWEGQDDVLLSTFEVLAPTTHASAFSETPAPGLDERSIWIGDHRGGLVHVDLREGKKAKGRWERWQVCERKVRVLRRGPGDDAGQVILLTEFDRRQIGAISVNLAAPHCIATASLDRHVRLFDVRALRDLPTTADAPHTYKNVDSARLAAVHQNAQIGSHEAKKACTSVDFSPLGDRLVAVNYDDMVQVWDLQLSTLNATKSRNKNASETNCLATVRNIKHNNQTGKWLTLFRAHWNGNPKLPPHFSIGSMNRRAEIYSADGTLLRALFDEDVVTAVPAVTAMHPSRPGRLATGNASGRATLWF